MYVEVKSSNGITLVPIETKLMTSRRVFVEGEINPQSACEFLKTIMQLNSESTKSYIDVFINSPGGEINSGLLMYDVIQSSKAPIRTYCIGRAYSMGAVLFSCGTHGRYILPHGEVMLHEPLLGSGVSGSSSSIKSISDSLIETKRKLNEILSKHTNHSVEELERETNHDHYFNAQESIDFGLCDKIIDFNEIMEG